MLRQYQLVTTGHIDETVKTVRKRLSQHASTFALNTNISAFDLIQYPFSKRTVLSSLLFPPNEHHPLERNDCDVHTKNRKLTKIYLF